METFDVPSGLGKACTVRASRQDYRFQDSRGRTKHKHDFIIFYLNGDCDENEEKTVTFQKNPKFWSNKNNLVYDGMLAEAAECSNPSKQRCFTLRADGEVAAFRIGKNNRKFFPMG